jgi:hypothetical protein
MSLMSAAEIAELDKMFGSGAAEAIVADAGQESKEPAQEAGDVKAVEAAVTESQKAQEPERVAEPERKSEPDVKAEEEVIRPVPYRRFQEVNSAKREAEARWQAAENRAAELEAKLAAVSALKQEASRQEPDGESDWLKRILDGEESDNRASARATDEIPAWAKPMLSELEQLRQERQMAELDRTVAQIQGHYPDLPEEVILSGLADGRAPEEIAVAWDHLGRAYAKAHGFVRQDATVAPVKEQAPKADVAPRLPASRGQLNAPEPKAWVQGWGKEHQKAVADFIKLQG